MTTEEHLSQQLSAFAKVKAHSESHSPWLEGKAHQTTIVHLICCDQTLWTALPAFHLNRWTAFGCNSCPVGSRKQLTICVVNTNPNKSKPLSGLMSEAMDEYVFGSHWDCGHELYPHLVYQSSSQWDPTRLDSTQVLPITDKQMPT